MGIFDEETQRANNQYNGSSRLSLAFSDRQLIGAIFGGLCTLAAAFITGALQGHVVGLGPGNASHPQPTVTITKTVINTVTASPSPSASPTPTEASPQPDSTPTIPSVPIMKPLINQTGWVLEWHRNVSIGPQGITLTSAGPQPSNGSNYDLQYLPGGEGGWNNNVSYSDFWSHQFKFGPANIMGIIGGRGYFDSVVGTQANLGDQLWTVSEGDDSITRITYMQVVSTGLDDVVVDMWMWQPA
jgi:hypothetical protein